MKRSWILTVILIIAGALITALPAYAEEGKPVDNRIWAELLSRHVRSGFVDYRGFKADEGKLDGYLKVLEAADPDEMGERKQMAFYINLYNAWTVKLILGGYPGVTSIKELGTVFKSPWKKKIVRVKGAVVTLDHVEHDILRPRFRDPRVHFAVNCASRGCPPLRPEPYAGPLLDRQLEDAAAGFLNDSRHNRLSGGILHVSRIFKWFRGDFDNDIVGFFRKYARGELKEGLDGKPGTVGVKYLDYDWSLNGA